jgi:hypothetical protein
VEVRLKCVLICTLQVRDSISTHTRKTFWICWNSVANASKYILIIALHSNSKRVSIQIRFRTRLRTCLPFSAIYYESSEFMFFNPFINRQIFSRGQEGCFDQMKSVCLHLVWLILMLIFHSRCRWICTYNFVVLSNSSEYSSMYKNEFFHSFSTRISWSEVETTYR